MLSTLSHHSVAAEYDSGGSMDGVLDSNIEGKISNLFRLQI